MLLKGGDREAKVNDHVQTCYDDKICFLRVEKN